MLARWSLDCGASSANFKMGLNTIWGVTPKPGRNVIDIVKERCWSFTMVVGIGFLLLVSLALSAWLAVLGVYVGYLPARPNGGVG